MGNLHGFALTSERDIPEISSLARLYRHQKTGAQLMSLLNEDENKVFGINFVTLPRDSSGVAHILEHSVLCGSRKFPVKAPFLQMMKGSLYTFLNAMTYADKTCYPVASQNLQDFYNLVDVYLDAVFFPRLTSETFAQEGWHYEIDNKDAPLALKGVVFNEMKGVYASPDMLIQMLSQESLFPDTIYGVSAGGDPAKIPQLSYEALRAFHARYYHPSNARLFFSGDDEPEKRLAIADAYLSQFDPRLTDEIAVQPRFNAPKRFEHTFAGGNGEHDARRGFVTINWMLGETTDPKEAIALEVLANILAGTHAAPLYKALIDSGLGDGLAGEGMALGQRQGFFSIGLKNIDPADAHKVEALVMDVLTGLAREGIEASTIEAAVQTMEFRLREWNTGSAPRGISYMLSALDFWMNGGDPLARLAFAEPIAELKTALAKRERPFEALIERWFIQNPHRTTLVLRADPTKAAREAAEERAHLDAQRSRMSPEALDEAVAWAQELEELQNTPDSPEALATIPSLTLGDLPRRNKAILLEVLATSGTRVFLHDLPTNGIVYADIGFDLHQLPPELLPFVRLFSRALLETGVGDEDFVALAERIGRLTGGIHGTRFVSAVRGSRRASAYLFLRAKCMAERSGDLVAILRDVLFKARLDNRDRIRQFIAEGKAALEGALLPSGSSYALSRLAAKFNEADWASEQMAGVSHLFFLRSLAQRIDTDWAGVRADFERMRGLLIDRATMLCNVTAAAADWRRFEPHLAGLLSELPMQSAPSADWTVNGGGSHEGLIMPTAVNYVAKAADLHALGFKPNGAVSVALKHLSTGWLWEKIRVQGGAYGASCSFDDTSGVFAFSSYRDPNLVATLDTFDGSPGFLRTMKLSDEELTRNIVGAIGDMDYYQLPDAKGYSSMARQLIGNTDDVRQRLRDDILACSAADVAAFGDALAAVGERGRVVVLGSEAAVEAAGRDRGAAFAMTQLM
jgi:Zn-dependent M16 (insulinase) family peptidase